MIESETRENLIKDTPTYPYIGRTTYSENNIYNVVLFVGVNQGFVVNTNDPKYKIGHYSIHWKESLFTYFNGEVVLKNSKLGV